MILLLVHRRAAPRLTEPSAEARHASWELGCLDTWVCVMGAACIFSNSLEMVLCVHAMQLRIHAQWWYAERTYEFFTLTTPLASWTLSLRLWHCVHC